MNYWGSTFISWEAPFDITYWGAICAHNADSVVIENNFIGGAQRSGIFYKGGLCPNTSSIGVTDSGVHMNHSIQNNIVHSALSGVSVFPIYTFENLSCVSISGFTIFKSTHWGIYYQNPPSVFMENNILVDNQVGVISFVIEPNANTHELSGKDFQIRNSIFIGRSSSFDCERDVKPSDFNSQWATSIVAFGSGPEELGMVGFVVGNFYGGSNGMPVKPWFV